MTLPKFTRTVRGAYVAPLLLVGFGLSAQAVLAESIAQATTQRNSTQTLESTETAGKPVAVDSDVVTMNATVESVDHSKREMTLRGENGNKVTLKVGPDVTRFNEVKPGDTVQIDYFDAVAVALHPQGSTVPTSGAQTAVVRDPGKRPSGSVTDTAVVSAEVKNVDEGKRELTLRGPDGNDMQVHVPPTVPDLEQVKPGDHLTVRYTRSLAIAVRKP
jgi:hypothetical protein